MKEYRHICDRAGDSNNLVFLLNKYAKQGWSLKTSTEAGGWITHWLEREVPQSTGTTPHNPEECVDCKLGLHGTVEST